MTDLSPWLKADILSLGMAADEARRTLRGAEATYLRVQVLAGSDAAAAEIPAEAAEVRVPALPASLEEALALVAVVRGRVGQRRIAAYSMADLEERAAHGWGSLESILQRLVAAGLSDVAELPLDRVEDPARALTVLAAAGGRPRRLTVQSPLGDAKLEVLDRVRACRRAVVTPLFVSPLPKQAPVDKPTTGYEDLRMVALTRLVLAEEPHAVESFVEVDWTLYGPKLAQVALTFGADHLDAVAATSDPAMGPRRSTVADVERNIRAAGFEPRELYPTA